MIRGTFGSRRWSRRERSFFRTRRLCTRQKRLGVRIMRDGIFCDDDKDYHNSWMRRLQRWMLTHKNPGQHSTFGFGSFGRKLRAASRRTQAQAEGCMLAELQEVAQQVAKAKVHRLCVQLARNGRGVKGRRYTHVAGSSPSLEEARSWLESPAWRVGCPRKIFLTLTRR